jgi:hypothetical protein
MARRFARVASTSAPARRLREDAGDGRNRHHEADAGLIPFLLGEKIDGEIRPQSLTDIRKEEIGGIERAVRPAQSCPVLAWRHRRLGWQFLLNGNGRGSVQFPDAL